MFGAKYSRLKFWIISLILLMVKIPLIILSYAPMGDIKTANISTIIFVVLLFSLPAIIWINTLANRIRDYGSNPWIALWALIPLGNLILGIYYGIANKKNQPIQNNDKENSNNDVPLSKAIYNHAKDLSSEIKPAINEYKRRHSNSNNFPNEDEETGRIFCPHCGKSNLKNNKTCWQCKKELNQYMTEIEDFNINYFTKLKNENK